MAATDKPYRNQKTLDVVFAVSSILMLLSVVWMMWADYNREYKNAGRLFRDVESVIAERQMIAALPDPAEVEATYKRIEDKRQALNQAKEGVKAKDQELTAKRDTATAHYREVKADFDSKSSFYNIEIGERDQEGLSKAVRKERADRVEARKKELDQIQDDLNKAQKDVDDLDAQYKREVTDPVAQADREVADAEDALKKLTGDFDRYAKQTVQKEWGIGDAFRSLPILDAFESPTKIKQIVLADLPIEYGSFKYVTRYDRCTSCHLGIDRTAGFDHRSLTKITRGANEAREARRAAVKTACNDILNAVGAALQKGDHDKLVALEAIVDKGEVVTKVEAHAPGAPLTPPKTPETTTGKVTKAEKGKITVQADDGAETTFDVPADAAVTMDGTPDKLENIKPNSRVTVVKGDDEDPFQVIDGVLTKFRDDVPAASDPTIQADLVRVKEENEDFREAQSLPKKLEMARRILQERKNKGDKTITFEPGDLPSHVRTVNLTSGQITEFASHPRLDLFVDSNSPHPMEKFGCSICHAGQGSATDFQLAAHTPADANQLKQWEDDHHWRATRDWEFPMLSSRFTESSCLKCHHEVTDLVRQGNKEEAPKLLRGFNLVRDNGCFGCHEIAGLKSGREVGPDLRLELSPALEWLSPTDQDKAKSDPANPPGTYRKVGPSLRRIAEKSNEEWARRWIQSPRGFRPDTKMPHFYNLSNDSPDGLPDDQKDYPAAEIHSIAHYLFHESAAGLKGDDSYRKALEGEISELQGRLQYSPLDDKDRKALADATHKLADLGLLSRPPNAAKINELAASLHETQNQLLEHYPQLADLEQKTADLQTRIVKLVEADLAEDGDEDQVLAKELDGVTTEFTNQAHRSVELARKYREEIKPEEVQELAGVKDKPGVREKRDKAYKDLMDKAEPVLQKRLEARQKAVDDLQKMVDDATQAVADAQKALDAAPDKDKEEKQKALEAANKKLDDVTKEVNAKLVDSQGVLARVQNEAAEVDRTKEELQKLTTDEGTALSQFMGTARSNLESQAKDLIAAGRTIPMETQLFDAEGEPVKDALPAPDKARLLDGRRVFSEKGCLACHVHDGVREKGGTNATDPQALPDAAATFAPDLSRVALKIAPKTGDATKDAAARRRWVVQWVTNPNIYHPRTRMPITHLSVEQACLVADWLLAQPAAEPADWPQDPKAPGARTLISLARVYLLKAPGMTTGKVDEVLPKDTTDLGKVNGFSEDELKNIPPDADEQLLKGPFTSDNATDKLERYIGKKSINRLGCYGCHDVPGFETAKPVGTALNDWGKKDPERLAFEDADVYAREHYNVVPTRYDAGDKSRPNPDFCSRAGKEPYEKVFFDALEQHTREGFLHQKLTEPRSFDYNRIRTWDDRLRMPQFRFARTRPRSGETQAAFEARQEREEGEAREAVMTFILGLVAEPIPLKYVNAPAPDRLAEVQGRKVLEKYNCIGCHQVRPGVYEFKSGKEAGKGKETLAALEQAYQEYVKDDTSGKNADHVFPGHNAWTGAPQWQPDRLTVYGTQAAIRSYRGKDWPKEVPSRDMLFVRLTDALRFANSDGVVRDIPAGGSPVYLPPEDVIDEAPPFGGAFGDLLSHKLGDQPGYVTHMNPSVYGDEDKERSALPPPLIREGERVQPKWLYQFLLNPTPVRPETYMVLRMPKFNMSGEEATALVNYFGAADRLSNPGAGLTFPYLSIPQTDEQYWKDQNKDYRKRLQDSGATPADRAAKLVHTADPLQKKLDAAEEAIKTVKDDDPMKKDKQKEIDDLKTQIQQHVKDWTDELVKEQDADKVYQADAYRLTATAVCLTCHNVGSMKTQGAKGPDLALAAERLRPEWTMRWISNPTRMFAYNTIMPQNFPNNEKARTQFNEYLAGQPIDRVKAARDVLMDLPQLEAMPAAVETRKRITGEKGP